MFENYRSPNHKIKITSKFPDLISRIQPVSFVLWVLGIILTVNTIILILLSLDWQLMHDSPIYHYIAWLMSRGAVPYKDIFDMNFPGTFLLHLFVIKVFGSGDLAWRLFDLAWLGVTDIFIIAYLRSYGTLPTVLAISLFSNFHLVGGEINIGERDYFLVLFILAGTHFVASSLEKKRASFSKLFIAGFLLGAGMMIKPYSGAFYVTLSIVVGIYAYRSGQSWWKPFLVFVVSGLVIPMAIFLWLTTVGGLIPFFDMIVNYLPLYSELTRIPMRQAIFMHFFTRSILDVTLIIALVMILLISLLYCIIQKHIELRQGLLILGVVYGMFHFFAQGRGWYYHLYPLMAFTFLLAASWVKRIQLKRQLGMYTIMLLFLFYLSIGLTMESINNIRSPIKFFLMDPTQLIYDLRGRLAPGETIQTIAHLGEFPQVLFKLHYPMATRFILTFHLFHHIDNPYIQRLRTEFLETLKIKKPKLIVIFKYDWTDKGYDRLKKFPEFEAWINKRYTLEIERNDYRLYSMK